MYCPVCVKVCFFLLELFLANAEFNTFRLAEVEPREPEAAF